MPRNSSGIYSLPTGNPVVSGTEIDSVWANTTMDDIGAELTNSLPRNGSAPMTGLLTLSSAAPTAGVHAVSKAYVDKFVAFATGMPIGAIMPYAAGAAPSAFLLCNGSAVSRATYADLFGLIGVTYGSGDGATTFNVPDLRDYFIRGKSASRALGSKQDDAFESHDHAVSQTAHSHAGTPHSHPLTLNAHTHTASSGVESAAHTHSTPFNGGSGGQFPYGLSAGGSAALDSGTQSANHTHVITVNSTPNFGGTIGDTTSATAEANATISLGVTGDTETRPQNMALDYYIKAINDSSASAGLTEIISSDPNMITIDNTDPTIPVLQIKSNVAFALVQLDANGKIPAALLP